MFPALTGETGVCPWRVSAAEWLRTGLTSWHVLTPTSGPTLSSESSLSSYYHQPTSVLVIRLQRLCSTDKSFPLSPISVLFVQPVWPLANPYPLQTRPLGKQNINHHKVTFMFSIVQVLWTDPIRWSVTSLSSENLQQKHEMLERLSHGSNSDQQSVQVEDFAWLWNVGSMCPQNYLWFTNNKISFQTLLDSMWTEGTMQ